MRRRSVLMSLAGFILFSWNTPVRPEEAPSFPKRPKLVVVLVIDQFRYDYLMRFRPNFVKGGFNRLLDGGAVYTDCRYDYATTITGPGHATLLTGAYPWAHGIVGNDWYDRGQKREVYCVEDLKSRIVANQAKPGATPAFSPKNLIGSTLGDELRLATNFRSKTISISLKDRAAVLMGGHTASAAYWYDVGSGRFVSSTYYMPTLPAWADEFNQKSRVSQFCGQKWQALPDTPGADGKVFSEYRPAGGEPCPDPKFLAWLDETPFMSEIEMGFATEAVRNEKLGEGPETDLLTVSLSVNDYIGHQSGPYSEQVADATLRTDRDLAKFFDDLDKLVGLGNVWIALSADHGVAPTPSFIEAHSLGVGSSLPVAVRGAAEKALTQAFGEGGWIVDQDESDLYIMDTPIKNNIPRARVEEVAAEGAARVPGVFAAFTRSDILKGALPNTSLARKVSNSFNSKRSGDVFLVYSPYAVPTSYPTGTTHGTPWNYDAQVPLIFWGSAFKPGIYQNACQPIDLAATLAAALGLSQPSGAEGKPLAVGMK